MEESGLFQIERFRPQEGDGEPAAKKSKSLARILEKAKKRAEHREKVKQNEEIDYETAAEVEPMSQDEPDVASSNDVASSDDEMEPENFKILDNVTETKKETIDISLPKWCQQANAIPATFENLEKLKKIKTLVRPEIYANIKALGFKTLFPVQYVLITKLLSRGPRRDFAVQAPTGSGKTLAYLIPMIEQVFKRTVPYIRGMVMAPTRVLAEQIYKVLLELIRGTHIKAKLLTGSRQTHFQAKLTIGDRNYSTADILVCTPGSLSDMEFDSGSKLDYFRLKYLVIDEADQMEGEWLKALEKKIPTNCQKLLFSATLARDPQFLAALKLKYPILYSTGGDLASTPTGLREEKIVTTLQLKPFVTRLIMKDYNKILIFTNKTETAEKLHILLNKLGEETELLSSSLDHDWKRTSAIKKLKAGRIRALVCSDVASRGLDIDDCDIVINYDQAPLEANHIHRSGRTARAGSTGVCLTFSNSSEYEAMMSKIGRKFHKRRVTKEITEEARKLAEQL